MLSRLKRVQPALTYASAHLDEDISLGALAAQTGLSSFHLHRVFSATAGETPKQFTLRLRLERAAGMLLYWTWRCPAASKVTKPSPGRFEGASG